MYRPFLAGNLLAHIEFFLLLVIFITLAYKTSLLSQVYTRYLAKKSKVIKITLLIMLIVSNGLIYIVLELLNIIWVASIAINAMILSLIIYLTSMIFLEDDLR